MIANKKSGILTAVSSVFLSLAIYSALRSNSKQEKG